MDAREAALQRQIDKVTGGLDPVEWLDRHPDVKAAAADAFARALAMIALRDRDAAA